MTANPSPRVWENSYGLAISQQHTLGNFAEAKQEKLLKQQHCWVRPVWPLAQTGQTGWAGNWNSRPVRPVTQTGQTGRSQTARQQSSKCQILSKWSPNPTKLEGKLRNYPVNISPKDLTQKIHGSREIEERSKRIGVFSRTQNRQFVRTLDSSRFSTWLEGLESSQRVYLTMNSRVGLLQTRNTPKEENWTQNAREKGRTRCSAHTSESQTDFIH